MILYSNQLVSINKESGDIISNFEFKSNKYLKFLIECEKFVLMIGNDSKFLLLNLDKNLKEILSLTLMEERSDDLNICSTPDGKLFCIYNKKILYY